MTPQSRGSKRRAKQWHKLVYFCVHVMFDLGVCIEVRMYGLVMGRGKKKKTKADL